MYCVYREVRSGEAGVCTSTEAALMKQENDECNILDRASPEGEGKNMLNEMELS